ncbi:MAG: hypothetical protein AB7O47_09290 [Flavobacteriales bacterium]
MKKNIIYLIAGLLLLSSCETEIDTLAEYEDITVVYGLLNPNDTTHYIKITKAFSGEGDATDLANNGSNFNYADGELNVTIDEYDASDVFKRSYSLSRTLNEIPKDPGVFDATQNVLYKFIEPNLRQDYTYKLKIVNNKLGKEITSETTIANNPLLSNQAQFEVGRIQLANASGGYLTHTFSITPSINTGRIKVYFIFNYTEHYTDLTNKNKQVKISLGEQKTTSLDGGDLLVFELDGNSFFSALQSSIPATVPNLSSRSISNATLEVIAAGADLSTYIAVNEPSTSVNQTKPEFTNLTNALGVFSSRNTRLLYSNTFLAGTVLNPSAPENIYGFNQDGQVNYDNNTLKALLSMGLDFCNARNEPVPLPVPPPAPRCETIIDTAYWYNNVNPN